MHSPSRACAGDCDGEGEVEINELIRAVNISLGFAPVSDCLAVDRDGSGTVSIAELIAAVRNSVEGCAP